MRPDHPNIVLDPLEIEQRSEAIVQRLQEAESGAAEFLDAYRLAHRSWPADWPYNRVPPAVQILLRSAEARKQGFVTLVHKAVLLTGLVEQRRVHSQHPAWRLALSSFDEAASQIALSCDEPRSGELSYPDDNFAKDVAIATGRGWGVDGLFFEAHRGIERSRVLRAGVAATVDLIRATMRGRGTRPAYEHHVYGRLLHRFTPEGRMNAYRVVAEAIAHDTSARGILGTAWYYDPAVAKISPRLAYLRQLPEARGAIFLKVETSQSDAASAVSKSENRRRLFESGQYRPQAFTLFWPRKALLAWRRAGYP